MHNPWIKMMVDEMDAGLFERAMLSQDERFGFKGHSPLLYGIENNHVDVVEFLLSVCEKHNLTSKICALTLEKVLGEDGTTYETVNKTALLLSIEKKQMRIAEFLVTKTNQAKNVDEQGRNAFHYLARMPNEIVEFFEMLESHGVSFITDKKGRRPLHYAVATLQAARSTDISTDNVEYLLAADPMATDVADVDSRIPLHYSFVPFEDNWKKHEEKPVEVREERTREKRRRQRRPEAAMEVDSNGNDAAASKVEKLIGFDSKKIAKSDPIPVVSLLLKQTNSKSLSLADKYGNSILHCAAAAGANICLLTLLHKMDDINAKNFIGNTPLAIAVENGYDSAAMTLIQAGSNVADKFYGPVPKPLDENLEKWTSWPMRSEKPVQRENTILSLIVRNGWQGIIYIVLDRLTDDSEHVLIEMLAAAVEHKQLNLAHSLLKKLKKVKNLGHRTTVIFENLAKVYSASTNEVKLFEALVEAGFSWLNADGTSLAAEKFAENEQLHGLNTLKQLDGKYNNSQNWKKLLQSETRGKIMKGLLKAKPRDYLLQLMSFIQEFADKDQFAQQLFDFCKPAFPGMEKIAKKKPEAEIQKVTALIYAIQTRKYGLMEFLLGKMANVNATDENGLSPMMHAILANDETAIKILLRMKDIQYKEKDSEGNVPVSNGGEDEDGMDEDEVDGITEEDDEESEASAEDAEESEEEVPRKRPRMLLTKKKRVSKKAVKAKKAPKKNIQYKEKDSEGNVPVLNEGEDEDGMDEDEVDGIAEEDDEESEASAEDAEESEEEVPRKRPRMLLTKKKRVSKKAVKANKAPKKSSFSFKNSKVEIFAVDKAGNNILHYFVAPNGFENIEMAKKFIQAEPMLKTLITKPNSESDSPLATAARNKQKAMFDLFCGFLAKNQIEQRLVKLVEFPSELGKIQRLECPFDLDQESADFVQRQTDAQRIPESEEEKRRKERKPHRMVHNAETSEIVEDDSTKKLYKVLMHKTDVSFGVYGFHNYYRMQLVQRKRSSLFVLFTHWGRIGDETGQCQHTPFNDKDLAIKEFKSIFKQKSGNEWDEKFVEKHGKYKLVQVEENPVNLVELKIELEAKSDQNEKSENEKAVGKVIKDLSNVKLLKNKWSALSGSISQNLPFGRITKEKLVRAQEILEECQALEARKTSKNLAPEVSLKISEDQYSLTNEFYMQIALGSFAFGKMRILENTQTIKQMENLLKQLFEFEIAAKLVTAAAGQTDLDPFEYIEAAIETQL
uniref:Poly [ADP-ribose] polymerase n=1 Tax=Panagrolaimus sp. JU765 TaxID=591449 RepID=A0AC34R3K8_9BILA